MASDLINKEAECSYKWQMMRLHPKAGGKHQRDGEDQGVDVMPRVRQNDLWKVSFQTELLKWSSRRLIFKRCNVYVEASLMQWEESWFGSFAKLWALEKKPLGFST